MKLQGKCARKTARVITQVKEVVEVGEVVSAKRILTRMHLRPDKNNFYVVPTNTHSLAMRLRGCSSFEMIVYEGKRNHHEWRRVE
jgi:hypothetical protein